MAAEGLRILLIRLSSLGDVILATAAVEALRQRWPSARISVLTKPEYRDIFGSNPGVYEVLEWAPAVAAGALAARLRRQRFDWVVDLHANLRSRWLRVLVPGPRWSVYAKGVLRRRLAVCLRRPDWLDPVHHVVDRYLAALEPLGVGAERQLPRLYPPLSARQRAAELLGGAGWDGHARLIGLAPGARWATKAWPVEHWERLAGDIVAASLGHPVFVGGPDEAGLCREILRRAGVVGSVVAGKTAVMETAAVVARCAALVTNDSAPLHLATAVDTPVVALFGPTHRGFGFYPLGVRDTLLDQPLDCRPCSLHGDDRCPEGHHRCLRDLSPVVVGEALRGLLGGTAGARSGGMVRGGGGVVYTRTADGDPQVNRE